MKSILYTLIGLCIIGVGLAYEAACISIFYFLCNNGWLLLGVIVLIGSFIIGDRIRKYGFVNIAVDEETDKTVSME